MTRVQILKLTFRDRYMLRDSYMLGDSIYLSFGKLAGNIGVRV